MRSPRLLRPHPARHPHRHQSGSDRRPEAIPPPPSTSVQPSARRLRRRGLRVRRIPRDPADLRPATPRRLGPARGKVRPHLRKARPTFSQRSARQACRPLRRCRRVGHRQGDGRRLHGDAGATGSSGLSRGTPEASTCATGSTGAGAAAGCSAARLAVNAGEAASPLRPRIQLSPATEPSDRALSDPSARTAASTL